MLDFDKIKNAVISALNGVEYSAVYLFGSYANGDFDEFSDVDIGLLTRYDVDRLKIIDLSETLEKDLGKDVDVVNINIDKEANYLLLGDIIDGCLINENEDVLGYIYDTGKDFEIDFCRFLLFGDDMYE